MKPITAFGVLLTSAVQMVSAAPFDVDVTFTPGPLNFTEADLAPVEYLSGAAKRAPAIGCIIRTWSSASCSGDNWAAWEYTPDGCRSCRSNNGRSHSFSLEENCPYGHLYAYAGDNCGGDWGAITIKGRGCYGVNTGYNWVSSKPCFGD